MSALAPCPSCQRHVFVSDAVCPFCGSRDARVARSVPKGLSRSGLSRAAMVALGTTTVMAAACGDDDDGDAMVTPLYGTALTTSSPEPSPPGSVPDSPSGMPTGSATASASTTEPINEVPIYGLPIMPTEPSNTGGAPGPDPNSPGEQGGMGGSSGSSETPVGSPDAGAMSDAGIDTDFDASTNSDAGTSEPEVEPFDDGGLDPDTPEPSAAPLYGLPSLR